MPEQEYDESEVISQLRSLVEEAGTQTEAASRLQISLSYLSDILKGHRGISAEVAEKLGFTRKIVFTPKE